MNAHGGQARLGEGNKTQAIYTLISEQKYQEGQKENKYKHTRSTKRQIKLELRSNRLIHNAYRFFPNHFALLSLAIKILTQELTAHPKSRAALALLGHCYYYIQDFPNAVHIYEQLTRLVPESQEYKMYLAQSYFKAGMYNEATKAALSVDASDPAIKQRMLHLQISIKYEQDDLHGCKLLVEQLDDEFVKDEPDTLVARGCIQYKEGEFEKAQKRFKDSMDALGNQPDLSYNMALCFYKLKNYGAALKNITEIVQKGVTEHPELSVGSNTDELQVRSVGNSQTLKETALIEAFNLKSAIEYQLKTIKPRRMHSPTCRHVTNKS